MLDGGLIQTGFAALSIGSLTGVGLMGGTLRNLRSRLTDYEGEVAEKDRRHTEDRAKIAQLASDLAALQRIVTGEAHWIKLGQTLDEHHEQAMRHWAKDEALLGKVLDAIREAS